MTDDADVIDYLVEGIWQAESGTKEECTAKAEAMLNEVRANALREAADAAQPGGAANYYSLTGRQVAHWLMGRASEIDGTGR